MKLIWTILAILYLLSPFDLLPERLLPLIGWLDDLVVVWLVWRAYYAVRGRTGGGPFGQAPGGRPETGDPGPKGPRAEGGRADANGGKASRPKDPHDVLGLSRGASPEEIRSAYRRLAATYHPDKLEHLGEEFRQLAEERFKEIQEAYRKLGGR